MLRSLFVLLGLALSVAAARGAEIAPANASVKFGIYLPRGAGARHPAVPGGISREAVETDCRFVVETDRLPFHPVATGMVWGIQVRMPREQGRCAKELMLYRIVITFPYDPATLPADPVAALYFPESKTLEMANITDGCELDHMMAFARGDPIGPHKVSVWLTQLDRSELGYARNHGRPADYAIEYDVYQADGNEPVPSGFAHCHIKDERDTRLADCRPKLDVTWAPPR